MMKVAKAILLHIICEPSETCISVLMIYIINVTQPMKTRHTLYLHSSKNKPNFMYMIPILVGPVTTKCKSLRDWVGHGFTSFKCFIPYIDNCLRRKAFVVFVDWLATAKFPE